MRKSVRRIADVHTVGIGGGQLLATNRLVFVGVVPEQIKRFEASFHKAVAIEDGHLLLFEVQSEPFLRRTALLHKPIHG